jgi:cyanophycinase
MSRVLGAKLRPTEVSPCRYRRYLGFLGVQALVLIAASHLLMGQAVAPSPRVGPVHGVLVLDGGPEATPAVAQRFVELAGGDDARIVLIPSAAGDDFARDPATLVSYRKLFGPKCCTILHTTQRSIADNPEFVEPLSTATGVWMVGGDTNILPDTYWHTATERALRALLERGGVVGGSSAGAVIQGSQIPTVHRDNGFSLLRNTLIIAHLNRNNARGILVGAVAENPQIIGIGISEKTAAIVTGDQLEVAGEGDVVIADGQSHEGKPFLVLGPGARFELKLRGRDASRK